MKILPNLGLLLLICLNACTAQEKPRGPKPVVAEKKVGGGCENCDLMYVGMPQHIGNVDTSDVWSEGQNKIKISGTVFKKGGETPAPGVLLYFYHTNAKGYYPQHRDAAGKIIRHGNLRGWVKTGLNGTYSIYTDRPGSYPNSDIPAHIHFIVKEAGFTAYYIDDVEFDTDPLLTEEKRKQLENRGGNGIFKFREENGQAAGTRDIILGLNIPGYD